MTPKIDFSAWMEQLQSMGRYTFSRKEMEAETGLSSASAMAALRRKRQRGHLASPRRGFYVIAPPEYRAAGSPPASWFIDDLMKYLSQPYYVTLLSAAALHGAAHQQPMVFQVATDRPTRQARVGKVTIRFSMNRRLPQMPVTTVQTETGSMWVATPETTAFDLVRDQAGAGHLNNTAQVLAELSDYLDPSALAAAADFMRKPDVQRLGYLLDAVGADKPADSLAAWLDKKRPRSIPLYKGGPGGVAADNRWHVQPNVELEFDL